MTCMTKFSGVKQCYGLGRNRAHVYTNQLTNQVRKFLFYNTFNVKKSF